MKFLSKIWQITGKFVAYYFLVAGGLWLVVEILDFGSDSFKPWLRPYWGWLIIVVPTIIALIRIIWYFWRQGHPPDEPVNGERNSLMTPMEIKKLLRSDRFTYAEIADILVPNLGYTVERLAGPNPRKDELANRLVEQAIADYKCEELLRQMRQLKPHLEISQECRP